MTQGIRKTMEEMTGYDVGTCPWRAFSDPFVRRVTAAVRWTTGEQSRNDLRDLEPEPSHKLIEGIALYRTIDNRVHGKQMEMESEKRKRASEASRATRGQ